MANDKSLSMDETLSTKIQNGAFIAAVMVVAIHTTGAALNSIRMDSALWWFEAFGHWGIFLVSVPYFFVCSGYFLAKHIEESGWWRRECAKRINSLFVPYIAWCVIFAMLPFVVFFFANLLHGRIAFMSVDLNRHFWIQTFGFSPCCFPGLGPLWYVRTLLAFVTVSPFLFYLLRKRWGAFITFIYIAAIVVGVGALYHNRVAEVFFYFFKLKGLFYFCLGGVLRMNEQYLTACNKRRDLRWVALGIGSLLIMITTLATLRTGQNYSLLSRVIFTPPLLFAFWHFIPSSPFPKWLTGNTFAIYLIHGVILKAMAICHYQQVATIPQWFVKWAIVLLGSVIVAVSLRRLIPSVARILFGGR